MGSVQQQAGRIVPHHLKPSALKALSKLARMAPSYATPARLIAPASREGSGACISRFGCASRFEVRGSTLDLPWCGVRATTMLRRRKSLSDMEAAEKKTIGWKQLSQRGLLQQPSGGQSTYVLESSGKRPAAVRRWLGVEVGSRPLHASELKKRGAAGAKKGAAGAWRFLRASGSRPPRLPEIVKPTDLLLTPHSHRSVGWAEDAERGYKTGFPSPQFNPYSWSPTATVVAIDSPPPPTGLSYCMEHGPCSDGTTCGPWTDTSTFKANYAVRGGHGHSARSTPSTEHTHTADSGPPPPPPPAVKYPGQYTHTQTPL